MVRILTDSYAVTKACGTSVARSRDIDDEISPKADDVILIVSTTTVFQRETHFTNGIRRYRGIRECIAVVPDLLLADQAEVIGPIQRHPLHVRLPEVIPGRRRPGEPDLIHPSATAG